MFNLIHQYRFKSLKTKEKLICEKDYTSYWDYTSNFLKVFKDLAVLLLFIGTKVLWQAGI